MASSLQELRMSQIQSLHAHNLTVKELVRNSEYQITLPLPAGAPNSPPTIYLIITLPPDFPQVAPVIHVRPPGLAHAWINAATGELTGHERLAKGGKWSQHVSLGRVVKEIGQELTMRPPVRSQNPSIAGSSLGSVPVPSSFGNQPSYSSSLNSFSPPPYPANPLLRASYSPPPPGNRTTPPPMPPKPPGASILSSSPLQHQQVPSQTASRPTPLPPSVLSDFPGLDEKTVEELEAMLSDETAFSSYFDSLLYVIEASTVESSIRSENDTIARRNLSLEPELEALKSTLREQQNVLKFQRDLFDQQLREQQQELVRFSPEYAINKLRGAVVESEDLSHSVEKSFRDRKIGAEDFLRQYREIRKVYHIRQAKLERAERGTVGVGGAVSSRSSTNSWGI
ncbi:hypothetical protein BJ742DRAFT_794284 [Cladochytrium replicatum]|nr:hypothetical protein BJ742DRAFT_794284 [Cladochytrium replicatum]